MRAKVVLALTGLAIAPASARASTELHLYLTPDGSARVGEVVTFDYKGGLSDEDGPSAQIDSFQEPLTQPCADTAAEEAARAAASPLDTMTIGEGPFDFTRQHTFATAGELGVCAYVTSGGVLVGGTSASLQVEAVKPPAPVPPDGVYHDPHTALSFRVSGNGTRISHLTFRCRGFGGKQLGQVSPRGGTAIRNAHFRFRIPSTHLRHGVGGRTAVEFRGRFDGKRFTGHTEDRDISELWPDFPWTARR